MRVNSLTEARERETIQANVRDEHPMGILEAASQCAGNSVSLLLESVCIGNVLCEVVVP